MAEPQLAAADVRDIVLSIVRLAPVNTVARRLAEAAMQLTAADYAALGAYDDRRRLQQFTAVGLGEEEQEAIGHPPHGLGLLGAFADSPRTINVPSAREHPTAAGFPAHHPTMEAFLGVPLIYGSQTIGVFYVARRVGEPAFSDDDQQRLEELAPYAAIAMANARTLEREHRRAVAAEALAQAARGLQQVTPERQTAEVLADALEALFPDAVALAICWSSDDARTWQRPSRWMDSALTGALERMLDGDPDAGQSTSAELQPGSHATVHVTHLDGGGRLAFAVAGEGPISDVEQISLRTLTEIGAIGLTASRRREAETALQRYAVRDEIARDLHDDLIQSIYAVGLSLQAARSATPDVIRTSLAKAGYDLNSVIRDLRSYITHLGRGPEEITPGAMLRTRIESLLQEAGTRTRWKSDIQLGDRPLGRQAERQLYLVVREAVSNVERHADASSASLHLERRGDILHLEVTDDGRGFDRASVSEDSVGLRSMEERVADLGGSIVIASTPGQGTSLIATMPVGETVNG